MFAFVCLRLETWNKIWSLTHFCLAVFLPRCLPITLRGKSLLLVASFLILPQGRAVGILVTLFVSFLWQRVWSKWQFSSFRYEHEEEYFCFTLRPIFLVSLCRQFYFVLQRPVYLMNQFWCKVFVQMSCIWCSHYNKTLFYNNNLVVIYICKALWIRNIIPLKRRKKSNLDSPTYHRTYMLLW